MAKQSLFQSRKPRQSFFAQGREIAPHATIGVPHVLDDYVSVHDFFSHRTVRRSSYYVRTTTHVLNRQMRPFSNFSGHSSAMSPSSCAFPTCPGACGGKNVGTPVFVRSTSFQYACPPGESEAS
jgi:hypothetical protein